MASTANYQSHWPPPRALTTGQIVSAMRNLITGVYLTEITHYGIALLNATAKTTGLKPGNYSGYFTAKLTMPGQAAVSMNVPVTLRIMATPPRFGAIVDAGGYRTTAVSQGQIVAIFGTGLGPDQGIAAPSPAAGQFVYSLGGTSVLIDTGPIPILYAQSNQIVAIVPYDAFISVLPVVAYNLSIQLGGTVAVSRSVTTSAPTPALFTSNGSGRGELAAENQDGSINSLSNPAKRGSMVLLYGSGIFPLMAHPEACDAESFATGILSRAVGPVEVTVGNQPADVLFAGVPLGMPCAVQQFNIVIPQESPVGAVPVTLRTRTTSYSPVWASAQDGLTLAVQ